MTELAIAPTAGGPIPAQPVTIQAAPPVDTGAALAAALTAHITSTSQAAAADAFRGLLMRVLGNL